MPTLPTLCICEKLELGPLLQLCYAAGVKGMGQRIEHPWDSRKYARLFQNVLVFRKKTIGSVCEQPNS